MGHRERTPAEAAELKLTFQDKPTEAHLEGQREGGCVPGSLTGLGGTHQSGGGKFALSEAGTSPAS